LRGAIDSWSGQPTFWFVNLCECHSPYLPPRPWNDLGAADRVRAALDAQRHLSFAAICLYAAGRHRIPEEALERMRHLYRRAVSYMDDWLAGILDALSARGIAEQTLVIVTADHGENFGEDGLIAHGFSVDQRLIHVPLVMAGPGTVDTDEVFSLAELPRLIAEAAGLQDHPWTARELPAGVAVAQHDPMGVPSDPRVRDFAERWQVDERGVEQLTSSLTGVTDGRRKLVVRNGVERFFDLERDPGETAPLEPAIANGSASLRAALEHPSVTATDDGPGQPGAPEAPSEEELAALEQQMKLLGYM
jgi:arylsulfatase A-like enzyme